MKKLFLILGLFLTFFPIVKAYPCSKEQTSRYEKLARQIQATYDYRETNDGIVFDITFHNVHSELYIADYDTFDYHVKYIADNGIILAEGYLPSDNYTFKVLNVKSRCNTQIIRNISITLPYYNSYSTDPLCKGISEFSLCQKWVNFGNLTEKEFKKSVEEYRKEKEKVGLTDRFLEEKTAWDKIRDFVAEYYIYIVIFIVLIATIAAYLINYNKKNKW